MKSRIIKRPKAQSDLVEHFTFIGEDNLDAAQRLLIAAEQAFGQLAEIPQRGRLGESQHAKLPGLRTLPIPGFRNYVVFYRPIETGIDVIRVLHGARDIDAILEAESPEP